MLAEHGIGIAESQFRKESGYSEFAKENPGRGHEIMDIFRVNAEKNRFTYPSIKKPKQRVPDSNKKILHTSVTLFTQNHWQLQGREVYCERFKLKNYAKNQTLA